MLYSIESVENGLVTLAGDDGQTIVIPVEQLAQTPRPGALVKRDTDGIYRADSAATRRRSSRILQLLQEIRRKSTEFSDDNKNI